MADKRFIRNTAMLFGAMAVTKIVGAVFKIPLANVLGGTGMGYFSAAYSLYSPVFAVTAAGIPTVVMRATARELAAERPKNALKLKRTAMMLFTLLGAAGMMAIWMLSGIFAEHIICSRESRAAIIAIAPAVLFCCTASVIRGHYEGCNNVIPTAVANITEAVSRAAIGLVLAYGTVFYAKYCFENQLLFLGRSFSSYEQAYNESLPVAAAAAILSVTLSELCGLIALVIHDRKCPVSSMMPENRPADRYRTIAADLLKELFPVAAFALVMNCFSFVDLMTVTRSLNRALDTNMQYFCIAFPEMMSTLHGSEDIANFMYGSYTGIAMSLFMLIPSFAGMPERTVMPEIAYAWEKKDIAAVRNKSRFLIRASAMIGYPACFGAAALAEPILKVLYSSRTAEISVCLNAFTVLCSFGMMMVTASCFSGIFQAIGKAHIPLFLMCGAVALKSILNPLLINIPEINISGAAIATAASYTAVTAVGLLLLKRYISGFGILSGIISPLIGGAVCAFAARICYDAVSMHCNGLLSTAFSVITGGIIYVLSLILTGFFRTKPIRKWEKPKKIRKGVAKS